jgi:hypothetical protein
MKKLTACVIAALLATAFSAAVAAPAHSRKHFASHSHKTRTTKPVAKPMTRVPVPADAFRA